jgi:hypothetical protein
MNFNKELFLENTRNIHLSTPGEIRAYDVIQDEDVREKLDAFIDYGGNSRISAALDEICDNVVGRTMFKVLIPKLQDKHMSIVCRCKDNRGSHYKKCVVYVNLARYEANGTGIPSRQYYYIKEDETLETKLKSLSGSIFHEFCHGLHHVSGTTADRTKNGTVWDNKEELRTITCFNHDPICDHIFDFNQSIIKGFPFLPRYSHKGWPSSKEDELLNCILESPKYMDGWKEYMIV